MSTGEQCPRASKLRFLIVEYLAEHARGGGSGLLREFMCNWVMER